MCASRPCSSSSAASFPTRNVHNSWEAPRDVCTALPEEQAHLAYRPPAHDSACQEMHMSQRVFLRGSNGRMHSTNVCKLFPEARTLGIHNSLVHHIALQEMHFNQTVGFKNISRHWISSTLCSGSANTRQAMMKPIKYSMRKRDTKDQQRCDWSSRPSCSRFAEKGISNCAEMMNSSFAVLAQEVDSISIWCCPSAHVHDGRFSTIARLITRLIIGLVMTKNRECLWMTKNRECPWWTILYHDMANNMACNDVKSSESTKMKDFLLRSYSMAMLSSTK